MAKSQKIHALGLGYAAGITAAISMLALSIISNYGYYNNAAEQMMKWHSFYSPTIIGTITGMIEAAVISFIFMYILGYSYNKFLK